MKKCPCGSRKNYEKCCETYIKKIKEAPTAELLMRSRYTAHVKKEINYIEETHNPDTRKEFNLEETRKWMEKSNWMGLEIIKTEKGTEEDQEGTVEFKANYQIEGKDYVHHELSTFVKKEGKWYFYKGLTPSSTMVRDGDKVGRNDPCPCGSGKKYKKCCG